MYLPRQIEVSDLSPMKVPKSFHYHLALKSIMRTLCQYVLKFFSKKMNLILQSRVDIEIWYERM